MANKQLKRVSLNEENFLKVINSYSIKRKVDSLFDYRYGYPNKPMIVYTDEALICKWNQLVHIGIVDELREDWYQVYCVRSDTQQIGVAPANNPSASCKRIKDILLKYYSEEEILETYYSHEKESSHIIHVPPITEQGKVLKFDNCYYYDAAGAYFSILIEMFPKARVGFQYLFDHRHDNNNEFKNDANYFVGCLTQNPKKRQEQINKGLTPRKIYPKTRHYIVDKVSQMLTELEERLSEKQIIYANTDGIIVKDPKNIIPGENKIGKFKLEYHGTIYTYRGDNYNLIQFGDEVDIIEDDLKGSLPLCLRDKVNLKEGRVIEFEKKKVNGVYQYINVKERQI